MFAPEQYEEQNYSKRGTLADFAGLAKMRGGYAQKQTEFFVGKQRKNYYHDRSVTTAAEP